MITKKNIVVYVILSIITCGIWSIVWEIQLADDIRTASKNNNLASGGMVFLLSLVTCGIYYFFWLYKAGEALDKIKISCGYGSGNKGLLYVILSLFGLYIVTFALMQSDLNDYIAQNNDL